MHDLPQNLLQQIKDFEDAFTVDRAKLKEIVNHFVKELEKGTFLNSVIHRGPLSNKGCFP
jgi:hexokinase